MTGGSLGLRTGSYGSLQQQPQNGISHIHTTPIVMRKPPKLLLPSSRDKEKLWSTFWRCFGRKKVAMLVLVALAVLVIVIGSFGVSKGLFSFPFFSILIFVLQLTYFGSKIGL